MVEQLIKLGLFDARVPRYTSYPTAPHFSADIGPRHFADWVAAIPAGAAISLYVHVPFCRRLCWFCACRTQGTSSDAPVRAYVEDLKTEIAALKDHLPPGVVLARLHWGGGTPTLLSPELISGLARAIFDLAPMAEDGEFSVEIDPNEIDVERLDALIAAGMNRASIGVQDFDPMIQKVIGREQGYALTRDVAGMIRAAGVKSLNADILFGLPHQTPAKIADSVEKLLALSPDRVALYGYAHVPWMARRQVMLPSDAMPTPKDRLKLFETARRLFLRDGYAEIGIDHFAKRTDGLARAQAEGRLRRNFQGYTDDGAPILVGLGASSISRFPQGYAQNASATSAHVAAIRDGRFSTARGHEFMPEDRLRGRMIEALMSDFQIDRAEMIEDHGAEPDWLDALFATAEAAFPGMLQRSAQGLSIVAQGRALTRMIARVFDAYELSKAGHSPAI